MSQDTSKEIETLKWRLEDRYSLLLQPGAIQRNLPEGWSVEIASFYDGGDIRLKVKGEEVLHVEKDAEYHQFSTTVPEAYQPKAGKLISFLVGIGDRLQAEIDARKAEERALREAEINAAIDAAIDDFPHP